MRSYCDSLKYRYILQEIYDILIQLAELNNSQVSDVFKKWNSSELESYLIQITAHILECKDDLPSVDVNVNPANPSSIVDMILDKTGMKGTGRWTVQEAAERSANIPTPYLMFMLFLNSKNTFIPDLSQPRLLQPP